MANKQDLIAKVAEATELTKKDSAAAVDAVFSAIESFLAEGEKVQLIGFGNFEVRERAARKGRNPQTGEEIEISASKVPAFKAGKALKDAVKYSIFKKPIISSVVTCLIGFFECFGAFLGHNQYFSSIFVTSVFIF